MGIWVYCYCSTVSAVVWQLLLGRLVYRKSKWADLYLLVLGEEGDEVMVRS